MIWGIKLVGDEQEQSDAHILLQKEVSEEKRLKWRSGSEIRQWTSLKARASGIRLLGVKFRSRNNTHLIVKLLGWKLKPSGAEHLF